MPFKDPAAKSEWRKRNRDKQREYMRRHVEKMLAINPDHFKRPYIPKPPRPRACKTCGATIADRRRYCSIACRPSSRPVASGRTTKYSSLPVVWRSHKIFARIATSLRSEVDRTTALDWNKFAQNLARILRLMRSKKKTTFEKVKASRRLNWESMARRQSADINYKSKNRPDTEYRQWIKKFQSMAGYMRCR